MSIHLRFYILKFGNKDALSISSLLSCRQNISCSTGFNASVIPFFGDQHTQQGRQISLSPSLPMLSHTPHPKAVCLLSTNSCGLNQFNPESSFLLCPSSCGDHLAQQSFCTGSIRQNQISLLPPKGNACFE